MNTNSSNSNIDFQNATGNIPFNMTNDYMFRAVLQKNNKVLRGLICSLLHLKEELNWKNRSISYLCRSYDQLHRGQDYSEVKPVIHIGFLDYTLFEEHPEFYATYKLMNVKDHRIYSDNLVLRVVDLTQIDLATAEDRAFQIDYWAALFKAKTWEDIKMLAEKNEYLDEASKTMFQLSADEQIKKRCLDREEYYQDLRAYEKAIAKKDVIIAEKDNALSEKDSIISEKDGIISEKDNIIAKLEAELAQYKNNSEK